MCLQIVASVPADAKTRISPDRLSALTKLSVGRSELGGRAALILSVTGGCSCEFLSDEAQFDCSEWSLASEHLPALANAVRVLSRECGAFTFVAHWLSGERPETELRISAAKLSALINQNRLGNNVLYNVR